MSGIYIHIPFCKQACYYCDFHFSTNTLRKAEMVKAICQEIAIQKDFFRLENGGASSEIQTIYFGGGTPSLLSEQELNQILEALHRHFTVAQSAEITLEANPDDLDKHKLMELKSAGINRLSIGIQSFHEPHLQFMNRAHNSQEAEGCVKASQDAGIVNLSIDLIYGVPAKEGLKANPHWIWEADMQKVAELSPTHISAYCLTIEPQTVFGKWEKQGKLPAIEEDFAAQQFEKLMDFAEANGFEQYEISNFGKPSFYSQHNTSYWQQKPYLGVGPSAHSFDGKNRFANIRNNALYLRSIGAGEVPAEKEILEKEDAINEYILTSLRTKWGTDLNYLKTHFDTDLARVKAKEISFQLSENAIQSEENYLILTKSGKLLADYIAQRLFV